HVALRMRFDELLHASAEGERADSHVIDRGAVTRQAIDRFHHGGVTSAQRDDSDVRFLAARADLRSRHRLRSGLHFLHQPIDALLIPGRILGVGAELRMAGAAREIAAPRRRAWNRARRDAVAVDVEIARELLDLLELRFAEHLAAIGAVAVVPRESWAHP